MKNNKEVFDHIELEIDLKRKGVTLKECSQAVGISRNSLKKKLDSKIPFRDYEMRRILMLLNNADNIELMKKYFFIQNKSSNEN